jgi:outer membrane protein OmpA-like peptidoglycan-associated protein
MKKLIICIIMSLVIVIPGHSSFAQTAEEWFQQGVSLEKQHIYQEAVKKYSKAIKLNSKYTEAYFRRGKSYAAVPSTSPEAIEDFTRAIALDPKYADAYYERGLMNAFLINNEQAKLDMEIAASLGHMGAQEWLDHRQKDAEYIYLNSYMDSGKEPIVYFDFDKASIKPVYQGLMGEAVIVLKDKLPEVFVVIMGHADSTGTEEYNDNLSSKRANAVSELLKQSGIDSSRIILRSYGESKPVTSNKTEEGRALNRRVELIGVKR